MATIIGTNSAEVLVGTALADVIKARASADTIISGGGDDLIIGGRGGDLIRSGGGADVIRYNNVRESNDAGMDTLLGFRPFQGDKIDLSGLLSTTDLHWGYMTPTANGVWIERVGVDTFVHVDVNGDPATVDMTIKLANFGTRPLQNTDFLGVENAAPVANTDTARVREDSGAIVHGRVLLNDTDPDGGTILHVSTPGTYKGNYGTLFLNANGSYSYVLKNGLSAVQNLNQGETLVDTFAYTATDSQLTGDGAIEITIVGVNEPVVTG